MAARKIIPFRAGGARPRSAEGQSGRVVPGYTTLPECQWRACNVERINDLKIIARRGVLIPSDFNFQAMRPSRQTGDYEIVVLGNEGRVVRIEGPRYHAAVNHVICDTEVWSDLPDPSDVGTGEKAYA